jgi:hypothetical protein
MTQYFVLANFWLVFAIMAVLGRTLERSDPNMYSFFRSGQWFYGGVYDLIVFGLFSVSALFFFLEWKTRNATKFQKSQGV